MSLRVGPFKRDPESGDMQFLKVELGKHLAGFEIYRQQFWGADVMVELGLKLLPSLGERAWLVVEHDELDNLEQEAHLILQNMHLIAQRTGVDLPHVEGYAQNILHSIGIARTVIGGVSIG